MQHECYIYTIFHFTHHLLVITHDGYVVGTLDWIGSRVLMYSLLTNQRRGGKIEKEEELESNSDE